MEVKLIECKLIDIPKNDAEYRSFNKEFAQTLASSIKVEGLYNAIVIRPHPTEPGRYLLVQGRHRHYAVSKVLKEQFIACNIMAEMDDQDAEMAMIAENLWRNPLTKNQHFKAIKKWHEHYVAKHPDMVGKGLAGGAATKKASDERKTKLENGETTNTNADTESAVSGFAEMVAGATGKSDSAAKRDIRVAKAFNDEQLEVFEQMSVSSKDMTAIAKIKDEQLRGQVVSLVAAGMEAENAIKEILKDQAPKASEAESKAKDDAEGKAAAKAVKQVDLTDDEWYATYCGEKAAMLGDDAKFKADAILFRSIVEPRHVFRTKVKNYVAAAKKGGILGPFYWLATRIISSSHPKDWLICGDCKGTGGHSLGVKCTKCNGACYQIKLEVYL